MARSIAFRSALLQRGGAQKFSVLSLIFLALIIFFLDIYGASFTKPVRGFINDVVYRVTFLVSAPTRFFPKASQDISTFLNVREENERLRNSSTQTSREFITPAFGSYFYGYRVMLLDSKKKVIQAVLWPSSLKKAIEKLKKKEEQEKKENSNK